MGAMSARLDSGARRFPNGVENQSVASEDDSQRANDHVGHAENNMHLG